jgi:hypothetical protein
VVIAGIDVGLRGIAPVCGSVAKIKVKRGRTTNECFPVTGRRDNMVGIRN